MEKKFGVVVSFVTGEWGYEAYDKGGNYENVMGCKSYEEAFEKAVSKGYMWESAETELA